MHHRLHRIIILCCMIVFFSTTLAGPLWAAQTETNETDQKAIVFILDAISWKDIRTANMPNLKQLIEESQVGLLNTKTKGLKKANPESGYLTLGVGMRANAPALSGRDVTVSEEGGIRVNRFDLIESVLKRDMPNYQAGQLGGSLKELGLKVALIGNADTGKTRHRESALMAMDEKGIIPYGNVGKGMVINDDQFPGGIRIDEQVLYNEANKLLAQVDVLFIDFGDTARIEYLYDSIPSVFQERNRALERADSFLGNLLKDVDWQNTMFVMIVPNASRNSVADGNASLTPVILRTDGVQPGLLMSNTTRREGLVANIDLAPTITNFLVGQKGDFVGEPFEYRHSKDNLTNIERKERKFYNLRMGRYITHGFYVTMIVLSLGFLFGPGLARRFRASEEFKLKLVVNTLTFPLVVFIIGPLLPFRHFIVETGTILVISLVLSMLLINWLRKIESILILLCISTSMVLLSYLFFAPSFLLNSPLGYDDVFLGGRYYGINNDAMGILLGSTVVGLFSLTQWTGLKPWAKYLIFIVYPLIVVLSLTPIFGANVGGTIAAMVVAVLLWLYLFSKTHLNWWKVLMVVAGVFCVELIIAYADALLSPSKSHAGKVMQALVSSGFTEKFFEIVVSKLRLFGLMLLVPPYNLILAVEIFIFLRIIKRKIPEIEALIVNLPEMNKGMYVLFYGGLIAFLFNDTGIISTALMYTYFLLPIGILSKSKI